PLDDGHLDAFDPGAREPEGRLLILLAEPVHQLETGGHPLGKGYVGERAVRIRVELAHRIGPARYRVEDGPTGFVHLIEHLRNSLGRLSLIIEAAIVPNVSNTARNKPHV